MGTAVDEDDLKATEFLDYDARPVQEFVHKALSGHGASMTDVERARALYYAVRDGIHYEIYQADLSRSGLRASSIIERGIGFCVQKSIVYAAAARAVGVPSRISYGDVRNHLASERLRKLVGGDTFCFHSFTSIYLEGRWVKTTPVFNKLLCRLYKITPLEFDSRSDSIHHPYDENGERRMEFVRMRGEFSDFPYDMVIQGIREEHPMLFASWDRLAAGSLVEESER